MTERVAHKIEDRVLKDVGTRYGKGLSKLLGKEFNIVRDMPSELTGVKSSRDMDMLFEVSEGYLVNVEFQSSINNYKEDLIRFRYYSACTMLNYQKDIETFVVYSAKFKPREVKLAGKFGNFKINPIFLSEISLDKELDRIEETYNRTGDITEYDKIILVLSTGLNYEGNRTNLISKVVSICGKIKDKEVVGNLFVSLSSKFLSKEEYRRFKEEFYMVDIIKEVREEGREEGREQGREEGMLITLSNNVQALAEVVGGIDKAMDILKLSSTKRAEVLKYIEANFKKPNSSMNNFGDM